MSPYLGPNQKVSAEVASNEIADLIERYVGPYHMTRAGVARALTVMFTERWDDLRRAAHQLHDALAIRKSLNMTDPSRNTNPAPPGPAEVNDPEYLPPLRNAADPSEPYTLAGAIERIKALEARDKDIFRMIRRECGDREVQITALVERCEKLEASLTSVTFAEGDIVSRKVGGPLMTVEASRTDKFIQCVWFDGAHVRRDAFAPHTLNKWKLVDG